MATLPDVCETEACSWRSPSPEATREAGRRLGRLLAHEPLTLALSGGLGAGKTLFVKGVAAGLGIDPDAVASPTFVIASEYEARDGPGLVHVDAYRVESVAELEAAGLLDWLASGRVVAIEWAERCGASLPREHLALRLERDRADPSVRQLTLRASGARSRAVLRTWRKTQSEGQESERWR